MYKLVVTVLAAAAALVHAQDTTTATTGTTTDTASTANPTDTSNIPACMLNCMEVSLAGGNCTSVTDFSCICGGTAFQTAAGLCVITNCPDLLDQASAILGQECANANSTGTAIGTAIGAHSGTGSAHASSSTTSHNAGFQTANIAAGATLALFGAAISLF